MSNETSIGGSISYHKLTAWWLREFSIDERRYIEQRFQPLGGSPNSLTTGNISYSSESAIGLLHSLAGWFATQSDRHLAFRMIAKAEQLVTRESKVMDLHFIYQQKTELYYKDRANPSSLARAEEACRQQIALAEKAAAQFRRELGRLPSHNGYWQLAVILEKQKRYKEAIELCQQAASQGWPGDWTTRAEKIRRRSVKQPM